MSEDRIFFQRAAEAIMQTSIHSSRIDPAIRELLNRIKHATASTETVKDSPSIPREQQQGIAEPPDNDAVHDKQAVLNYFDRLLGSRQAEETTSGRKRTSITGGSSSRKRSKAHSSIALEKTSESSSHSADDSSMDERRFQCTKCDLVFRRSGDLRRHEKVHLSILPNICSLCGKGFARKDALKRHCGTLTCKRNRQKLLSIGGDINEILEKVRQNGAQV